MLNKLIKGHWETTSSINTIVTTNYSKLKLSLFFFPLLLLLAIALFLYSQDSLTALKYVEIQKNLFLFINSELAQFPNTIYNLTQLGDALISLSFVTIFIVYAPKMWEALLSASIVSGLFSNVLKNLFSIPRPAQALDHHSFVIIGKTLVGFSSLPSGHSITTFTTLTVLLYAFLPKKWYHKMLFYFFILMIGLIVVFTRVGVGAHFPLDVTTGSIIGYISGLIGIFITQKYKIWAWINTKKYYPILILLLLICCVVVLDKIVAENLVIFYFSLLSLIVSLLIITTLYVKK
jgi:membrane-associated phospholipid phosphatase